MARALTTAIPRAAADQRFSPGGRRAVAVVLACYLLGAVAVTWHLWADPASRTVAGNPNDADLFAWFLRYAATAISHGRLPALVTAAMNAPQGINLMWNTPLLLPAIVLTPVTLLFGPQVSLTVLVTAGYAGSAASLYLVLRRWRVSTGAAALAGAVYGFSPALVQAAIGHYSLQFAVLPPLIADAALRLWAGSPAPWRDGVRLGLLAVAQLFIAEELLLSAVLACLLIVAVLAIGGPRPALRGLAAGLGTAAAVILLLAGYPLWVQFFGPLTQHGSPFLADFYKNDLTGFVTPSGYLLFHTTASAAAAARYQGGPPEYLAYLGWPLILMLAAATVAFWRKPVIRALAVATAALELLSLGGHPLIGGTTQQGVQLPWHWLAALPVLGAALPNRLSIVADGTAAALLAFAVDAARRRLAAGPASLSAASPAAASTRRPGRLAALRWPGLPLAIGVAAVLPLIPLPLPAARPAPLPAGWSAALAALHLPADARVLVVPVPTATLTEALRWQADTGRPGLLNGGYFAGPAWNGQAYIEGNGVALTAQYLNYLWSLGQAGSPAQGAPGGPAPGLTPVARPDAAQLHADLATWRPAAVLADTSLDSALGHYLLTVLGRPAVTAGQVAGWRLPAGPG